MKFHLIDSGFLKHPQQKHNPCYRKIICFSLFRYIKGNDMQHGLNEFNRLINHVEDGNLYILTKFLELYPFPMTDDGKIGYLLVEPSRGCFPLVIYPNQHSQNGKTRKSGFHTALSKLRKNQSEIFKALNEHSEWSFELEAKLERLFGYPSNDGNFSNRLPKTG